MASLFTRLRFAAPIARVLSASRAYVTVASRLAIARRLPARRAVAVGAGLAALVALPSAALCACPNPRELAPKLRLADTLYDQAKYQDLHEFLEKANAQYGGDCGEIMWRLARAKHELALDPTVANEAKKKFVYDAHALAKRAIEVDPTNFACHKWFAITLSDVGDFEGIKIKIGNAFVIRDHFVKAIELNPKDATSRHLLGLWCFTFAEMPWYQQKIASALFATPPTSTYDEALRHFLQAEEIDPGFYLKNAVMVAKTYQRMGNAAEFNKWIEVALAMPVRNPSDKEAHDEAVALRGKK